MMCFRISIPFLIFLCTIIGCVSTPGELEFVTYKTKHFKINYQDRYFTDNEIAAIGEKKEYLLQYIVSTLGVDFDDEITAYLYYKEEQYAYVFNGVTYESRDYVLKDDGHEIAHIVSFSKLGRSKSNFLLEGLAVALEYKTDDYNVIEEYLAYKPSVSEKRSDSLYIASQILENRFDYTYYSYRKAGAFLCYLSNIYGMDKLKEFYSESCRVSLSGLGTVFRQMYGFDLFVAENNFRELYFPESEKKQRN
jgi:hypothetical protein